MKSHQVTLALAAAVLLAGCATKDYVNEQIASLSQRMDSQQADTSGKLDQSVSQIQGLEGRVSSQEVALDNVSRTAQEALDRAEAAGKLAQGKFLYETTFSSQVANFSFNGSKLSDEMKQALDAFAAKVKADNRNVF
ncbi:MAG: hypothetical protein WAK92_13035, partial [Thiobacillus sp.]